MCGKWRNVQEQQQEHYMHIKARVNGHQLIRYEWRLIRRIAPFVVRLPSNYSRTKNTHFCSPFATRYNISFIPYSSSHIKSIWPTSAHKKQHKHKLNQNARLPSHTKGMKRQAPSKWSNKKSNDWSLFIHCVCCLAINPAHMCSNKI